MNQVSSKQKLARKQASEWIVKLSSDNPNEDDHLEDEFLSWLHRSPENQIAYLRAEWLWTNSSKLTSQETIETCSSSSFSGFGFSSPSSETFSYSFSQYLSQHWAQYKALTVSLTSILLVSFVGLGVFSLSGNSVQNDIFLTHHGEIKTYQLKDGSSATLNSNSKIHVSISNDNREVELIDGEAFFNVKKIKGVPFSVKGREVSVRVLGTQFSVKNSPESSSVIVLEGKVRVSSASSPEIEAVTLTKDKSALLSKETTEITTKDTNARESLSWRNKKLIYNGEPLSKVISDLNKHFKKQTKLANKKLGDTKVVAVISINNQEATLRKIESLFNLTAQYNQEDKIIYLEEHQSN